MNELFNKKERVMQGKLSITKIIEDGTQEKLQEFSNIPVQGLGYSLARLFASKSSDSNLDNFRFNYFQLGSGFVDYIPQGDTNKSLFYRLNTPLTFSQYGTDIDSKLVVEEQLYTEEFDPTVGLELSSVSAPMLEIPLSKITRIGDSVIKIQLVVDKNMAVGSNIEEIGLLIKNPDENFKTDKAILAAYKYFKPISKTNQFSLVFDWIIQIVDLSVEEEWTNVESETHRQPFLFYNTIVVDASTGTFNFAPSVNQDILNGSYTFTAVSPEGIDMGIDSVSILSNGTISVKVVPANIHWGTGTAYVTAIPSDSFYGNSIQSIFPITINYTGLGSGGTGSTGGTASNGSGTSTGAMFKGPRIGDIDWVFPYTNTTYDYTTSQVVVLKAILPTDKSSDFHSAPGLDRWMVEGGSPGAITTSCIAQIHSVTRDPSGYPTNVEVIFSALAIPPSIDPDDNLMNYQTFRLFQASGSLASTRPSLSSLSRLHFQVVDTSANRYNCKFFTTIAGVVFFNPDSNPSITSSLIKDGPYLRTYRFYGRTVPSGYDGGFRNWNVNDPDHEVKPFGPSVHAFVTIRHGQEIANIDFRISNGHIHRPGYAGVTDDPIPYEAESSNVPGYSGPSDTAHVIGNFYYTTMLVDFGSDTSATSYIDKWDIKLSSPGKYLLVSSFPTNADPNQQLVHCLPSMKALVHRFGVFKTANVTNYNFAKHEARGHYQAFPKIGNQTNPTYRNYQNIRAWGYHGDILPDFDNPFFNITLVEDMGAGSNGYSTNGIPGRAGQRRLAINKFNDANNAWGTGGYLLSPSLGFGENGQSSKTYNCPFMYNDVRDGTDGGINNIIMTPASRQMYEELDAINVRYESTVPRLATMFNVSGNPLTLREIIAEQSPAAITDASGYTAFYASTPVFSDSRNNHIESSHAYLIDKGLWGTTEPAGFYVWEYPSKFVRALSNSRRSQPGDGSNFNIYAGQNNKCPYFFRATQIYYGAAWNGMGMFDYSHSERAVWPTYSIAMGKNDPMAKEDLQNIAEFYLHTASPYLINSYNKFAIDTAIPGYLNLNNKNIAVKSLFSTHPSFSGIGYNVFTDRGTALQAQLMVNYWTLAEDTWRTNNQLYFNYTASAYAYGCSKENGTFVPGGDAGGPSVNLLGNSLCDNNYYKFFTQDGIENTLPTGKQYWYGNPDLINDNADPNGVLCGLYPGDSSQSLLGGTIAASSTIVQSFFEMYAKEAALSLARLQIPTSSILKNMILSSVALGCSTAFSPPVFGTMSGVIGDIYWTDIALNDIISLGATVTQAQFLNDYFFTRLQDPSNREHGTSYWWPIGLNYQMYVNGNFGYSSGIGHKRSYTTSDSGFGKAVAGQFYVTPYYTAGPGRNRDDCWPVLAAGMVTTIGDSQLNTSSILANNYFIRKGPEYLATDQDYYFSNTTSAYFQNNDDANLKNRAAFGITNSLLKNSGQKGLQYNAVYIAYLLKFLGYI